MKTILKISVLPVLLIAFASAASASSIQLGSYGTGDSSMGNSNGALVYEGYSTTSTGTFNLPPQHPFPAPDVHNTYDVSPNTDWHAAIPGSSWVSNETNGNQNPSGEDIGYYKYTTTFTATPGSYSGVLDLLADDTAEVLLNGIEIVGFSGGGDTECEQNAPNCREYSPIDFNAVLSGTNTLTIIDYQGVNNTPLGVDFSAKLTPTPEPSSMLLLGTGLLGLAFVAFRKAKATRPAFLNM
jgi:hypothetical protein